MKSSPSMGLLMALCFTPLSASVSAPAAPLDIGPDAAPQLPQVSAMVFAAADTSKSLAAQAKKLQDQVVQLLSEDAAKIAKLRAIYDHQLKKEDRANRAINATNHNISRQIEKFNASNAASEKLAKDLEKANDMLRTEMSVLQSKVGMSQEFLAVTFASTDDSKAEELDALQDPQANPIKDIVAPQKIITKTDTVSKFMEDEEHEVQQIATVHGEHSKVGAAETSFDAEAKQIAEEEKEEDDEADDAEDGEEPESFLQGTKIHLHALAAGNPGALVNVLSMGLENFTQEARDSVAKLKAAYVLAHKAGKRHKHELLAVQKTLNATLASLLSRSKQLRAADDHLIGRQEEMKKRLRGFGTFIQRLAHVALAPASTATHLMNDLPGIITIPTASPKSASKP